MNNAQEWAAKVDRAANDPGRIERRKGFDPALTVPRHSLEVEPTVTYLSAEALAEMEASETKIPESHAIKAKELRAKFLR